LEAVLRGQVTISKVIVPAAEKQKVNVASDNSYNDDNNNNNFNNFNNNNNSVESSPAASPNVSKRPLTDSKEDKSSPTITKPKSKGSILKRIKILCVCVFKIPKKKIIIFLFIGFSIRSKSSDSRKENRDKLRKMGKQVTKLFAEKKYEDALTVNREEESNKLVPIFYW
jgi:hypothetical protein